MLLIIDNYDSFTYNLVQYFEELGQKVEVYRNDQISVEEIEKKITSVFSDFTWTMHSFRSWNFSRFC